MNRDDISLNGYVDRCWDKVYEYRDGISNGSIIVNKYMKSVVRWFVESPEYEIKTKKVDRIFRFLYLINIAYDEEGYKRIELLPWQAYLIAMIFGMYHRGTNNRRFSESFTFMGRGNGKTTLGVALSLYFLLGYNQISPESVIISTVENRAKVIKDLHKTVMHSPELHQFLHFNNGAVMLNSYDANIKRGDRPIKRLNDVGGIKVVPNNDEKLDGLELVLAFIDEIHLLNDEKVFRNAQKSAGKRKDSLVMLISTAGYSSTGFCVDLVDRAKKVALGEIKDEKFLPFLYCLDKEDDPEDFGNEDLWHKCNPSLGKTLTLRRIAEYHNDAINSPKAKADFITKTLNVFIDYNEYEVVSAEDFRKATKKIDLEKWQGKDCYLGLDLSKSNDLSSLVCLFHDEENNMWEFLPYYWVGNDSKLFNRKTGENLEKWINRGYITMCDSKDIDYTLIVKKIEELSHQFNIVGIGYDNYGWNLFNKYLKEVDCGEKFVVKQHTSGMAAPLSDILMSFISGRIIFSDNPVMLWNWKNARIRQSDSNGNLKIWKNESKDSVDGAVAMNDAMALYYHRNYDPQPGAPII
jgi:phage terminase large subunit-like protein